jgi:hypothetical protein
MPDGRLAYLDFGMMSEVKPYQRYGLIEAVVHMVNRDFEGLANDYVKLEFLSPDTDLRPIIPALAEVFSNALGASVAELNFKSITDEFSALMYEYPFRVPAYYALIIRSLVTLEGIAINVDPEFKVLSKAYPYVSKRLLTDPSPELRASLQDLLFKDGSSAGTGWRTCCAMPAAAMITIWIGWWIKPWNFLFSERGAVFARSHRQRAGQQPGCTGTEHPGNITTTVRRRMGWAARTLPEVAPATVVGQQRPGSFKTHSRHFERHERVRCRSKLATRLPATLLVKSETRDMGQQVVTGLAQRALARFIRALLVDDATLGNVNGGYRPEMSLPASVKHGA